jgi:hypothetical protein
MNCINMIFMISFSIAQLKLMGSWCPLFATFYCIEIGLANAGNVTLYLDLCSLIARLPACWLTTTTCYSIFEKEESPFEFVDET